MLVWVYTFLACALLSALFGFTSLGGDFDVLARAACFLFLLLFVIAFVLHLAR